MSYLVYIHVEMILHKMQYKKYNVGCLMLSYTDFVILSCHRCCWAHSGPIFHPDSKSAISFFPSWKFTNIFAVSVFLNFFNSEFQQPICCLKNGMEIKHILTQKTFSPIKRSIDLLFKSTLKVFYFLKPTY